MGKTRSESVASAKKAVHSFRKHGLGNENK